MTEQKTPTEQPQKQPKVKAIPEKTVEELKAKHGDVLLLTSTEIEGEAQVQCAFKRPSRAIYRKWKAEAADDRKKTMAIENLAIACLVYPSPEEFDNLLDAHPAFGDSFGVALLEAAGSGASDAKKA